MPKRRLSDKNRRRLLIAAGVAVVIALILWALPVGVRWGADKYLTGQGVDTQIEDVDLNLFTGTLAITNAQGKNAQGEGFKIDHALVNLDYWPLIHKQIYLSQLELRDSRVDVRVDQDGQLAVAGLSLGGGPEEEEQKEESPPWGFGLERAKIGALTLRYHQPDFERTVTLSSSSTSDIATWEPKEPFPLDAELRVGDSRIRVTGSLKPFGEHISGDVNLGIQDFKLELIAPLLKQAGIEHLTGTLSSDLQAKLDYAAEAGLKLDVDGKTGLAGMQLTMPGTRINNAGIDWQGEIAAQLLQRGDIGDHINAAGTLKLDKLDLAVPDTLTLTQDALQWQGTADTTLAAAGPKVNAEGHLQTDNTQLTLAADDTQLQQGSLDWQGKVEMTPGENGPSVAAAGKLAADGTDLALPANGVKLAQKALHWDGKVDYAPGEPAVVHGAGGLELQGTDLNLAQQQMAVAGERVKWSGQFALDSAAEGIPEGSDLPLSADGELNGSGIAVTDSARGKQLARLADIGLSGLAIRDLNDIRGDALKVSGLTALARAADAPRTDEHANILQIDTLSAEPLRLSNQNRLVLNSVTVSGIDGLLYRGPKGGFEIADWFASPDGVPQQSRPAPASTATAEKRQSTEPGFEIAIGKLQVRDSRLAIDDRGISPAFATQLSKLNIALADLDSGKPTQGSALDIASKIGRYGNLKIDGTVKPFLQPPSAKLTGKINAVNLAPISGYAAQAIDRRIDQGTFSADLKFNLNRGDIDANAGLTLTKLHIGGVQGNSGEVHDKLGLPLDKILSLLRDGDGNIHLNLPVGGNLQNPTFSIMDIVRKAVLKGLQTAVIAVYSPLGLLKVGKGLIDLATALHFDPVMFEPGGSSLNDGTRAQLDKVAKVLNEHPQTDLVLCGHAVPTDREALGLASASVPEGESKPSSEALADARDKLLHLADARAGAVGGHLVSRGLNGDRLVPCNPSLGEPADAKPRTTLSF